MATKPIATVEQVTITPLLVGRPLRRRADDENRQILMLSSTATSAAVAEGCDQCAKIAMKLCQADSCGISVGEAAADGQRVFRRVALTGVLAGHLAGTTPRLSSPCGVTVDAGTPILMRRPELAYPYLGVGTPLHDLLLVPLTPRRDPVEGAIWVVMHNTARKFDAQDARILGSIAAIASRLVKRPQQPQ